MSKSSLKNLFKSFLWFFLTLFVGLSQVWVTWLIGKAGNSQLSLKQFIIDGILLFFSVVLVASLVIDYFLFKKTTDIIGVKKEFQIPLNIEFITIVSIWALAATAIYAILIKLDDLKNQPTN